MSDVEELINSVMSDELVSAGDKFNEIMNSKIAAALDQAKVDISSSVFSSWGGEGPEDEEDEDVDYEITDEDIENLTDEELADLWDDTDLDMPDYESEQDA